MIALPDDPVGVVAAVIVEAYGQGYAVVDADRDAARAALDLVASWVPELGAALREFEPPTASDPPLPPAVRWVRRQGDCWRE